MWQIVSSNKCRENTLYCSMYLKVGIMKRVNSLKYLGQICVKITYHGSTKTTLWSNQIRSPTKIRIFKTIAEIIAIYRRLMAMDTGDGS